jgi:hypothetical protein
MGQRKVRPPVERIRNGYRINLADDEKDLLRHLLVQLRDLLNGPNDHPALTRIFPAAYHQPQYAEFDAEYQRLMRDDLVTSRLAGIQIVEEALNAKPPLKEIQLLAMTQAVNGIRLVLGTVLDVTEELDLDDITDDDPHVSEYHLYGFLSWLLEWTVRAISGEQR